MGALHIYITHIMNTLNQYNHNLAGRTIVRDNGNWSVNGRWYREVYTVHADGSVEHIKTQHFWNNVAGREEEHSGSRFVPDCDGSAVYIAGIECKLPSGAEFELLPLHTCEAPSFHEYSYTVDGKAYTESYAFCNPSEANSKWAEFVASFPQYAFNLLGIKRTA